MMNIYICPGPNDRIIMHVTMSIATDCLGSADIYNNEDATKLFLILKYESAN